MCDESSLFFVRFCIFILFYYSFRRNSVEGAVHMVCFVLFHTRLRQNSGICMFVYAIQSKWIILSSTSSKKNVGQDLYGFLFTELDGIVVVKKTFTVLFFSGFS